MLESDVESNMAKKKAQRPTTPQEIEVFEQKVNQWLLANMKNKRGKQIEVSYEVDVDPNQDEEITEIKALLEQQADQNQNELLDLYRSGKFSRFERPLPPILFDNDTKAKSSVPYLKVSMSSSLDEQEEAHRLLDLKVRR